MENIHQKKNNSLGDTSISYLPEQQIVRKERNKRHIEASLAIFTRMQLECRCWCFSAIHAEALLLKTWHKRGVKAPRAGEGVEDKAIKARGGVKRREKVSKKESDQLAKINYKEKKRCNFVTKDEVRNGLV